MEALTLVALAALVVKVMTVIKSVGKDNRAVATQAVTWVVGIVVAFLAAHAKVASDLVVFGSFRLGDLDASSLILVGVSLGSLGSTLLHDFPNAIDNQSTVVEPKLGPGPGA